MNEQLHLRQLPTTPSKLNFDVDLPQSPVSSSSLSSIHDRSVSSPDSILPSQTGQETVKFVEKKYRTTIVSGDQLTFSRIHGSQKIRGNSDTSEQRLDGLLPVSGDWHSKMCFMEVSICVYTCVCT